MKKTKESDCQTVLLIGGSLNGDWREIKQKFHIIRAKNREEAKRILFGSSQIMLETRTGVVKVEKQDVLYAEVINRKLKVITRKGPIEEVKCGMAELIKRFDDKMFCRCHKSFALNVDNVEEIGKAARRMWKANFVNGKETCLVSSVYYDDVIKRLEEQM